MPAAATSKTKRAAVAAAGLPTNWRGGQLPRELAIEWRSVTRVKRYDTNPRQNDQAVPEVARSLADFGWQQPLVIDKQGVIVVGDTRYLAALLLQQTHVPVYVAKHLSPERAKAYRLADNKYGERAKWDYERLKLEFEGLTAMGADLAMTGFRDFEMAPILASEWSPQAPSGTLGGERDTEGVAGESGSNDDDTPDVVRFTVDQLEVVLRAAERVRTKQKDVRLSVAECLVLVSKEYLRG